MKQILDELPLEGERLIALWWQIPESRQGWGDQLYTPLDQLRYLLARLMTDFSRYRVFDWQPEVPWTNHGSEKVIGKMKIWV